MPYINNMAMPINNWNISLFRTSIFLIVYGPWNPTKFNSSAVGDAPRKRPTNWLFWVVHSKFIFFWEQHWWRYSHNDQYTRYDYQKYWKAQGRSLTSEFEALFVFIYLKALETGKRITLLSKFVKMLFLQQRNTIKTCILHYVGME